jgi:ribonuclease P protein component
VDTKTGNEHSWVKRSFRLTRSTEFKRVRRFGKSYAHPLIVLVVLPMPGENIRVGVAASRTVGGAVQRNRAKRLLREAIRPLLPQIKPGWHVLLLCRSTLLDQSFLEISRALHQLLQKARLLNNQDGYNSCG